MMFHPVSDEDEHRGPSREEIEVLCILHAVDARVSSASELAGSLGLSPALASAAAVAAHTLVTAGWLRLVEDRFQLTDDGREHLTRRLSDFGIS